MAELLIGNVESDTSDDEIKAFLVKYGFPPFDGIEHILGDGSRPAVLLTFKDVVRETLCALQPRINGIFWKNRKLNVLVPRERYS